MRDIEEALKLGRDLIYSNQRIADNVGSVSAQMGASISLSNSAGPIEIDWNNAFMQEHIRLQRMEAWLQGAYPEVHEQWKALQALEKSIAVNEEGK